jgi:hypothetical protein
MESGGLIHNETDYVLEKSLSVAKKKKRTAGLQLFTF